MRARMPQEEHARRLKKHVSPKKKKDLSARKRTSFFSGERFFVMLLYVPDYAVRQAAVLHASL